MATLLIIDDDRSIRRSLETAFKDLGHDVVLAGTLSDGIASWKSERPEVVFLDLTLPDGSGMDLLKQKEEDGLPGMVIMITGHQDLDKAIQAMRLGAFDYIHKPMKLNQLEETLGRALRDIELSNRSTIEADPDADQPQSEMIGTSQVIIDIHKQIGLASRGRANVLVTGESGTGKELVARAIHRNTNPDLPFIPVNCSAFVSTLLESELFGHEKGAFTGAVATKKGRLEQAGSGTLFLDEIGDLDTSLQVKLLRVLQERTFERVGGTESIPFNARVIAATHRNLVQMVTDESFREDLYYRLKVVEIHIPPLRERKQDLLPLVKHFLVKSNRELNRSVFRIPDPLIAAMEKHDWPGNVRELENRVMSGVMLSPADTLHMEIPEPQEGVYLQPSTKASAEEWKRSLEAVEVQHIKEVFDKSGRNLTKACEILGISRPTLRRKIEEYGL